MLKRIRLKDFKSFVDEEVEVAPLTLLVGANASGKSNFLDAIRFLQGISFDLYLGEVLNGETRARPDAWPGIRGRAEETVRSGSDAFGMRALWIAAEPVDRTKPEGVQVEGKRAEIFHSVICVVSPQVYFAEEECGEVGTSNSAFRSGSGKSFIGDRDLHRRQGTPEESVVKKLRSILREIQLLSINPENMRSYGRRDELLGEDGNNISGVLALLCEDPEKKESFIDWLREFCAPEIEDLDFLEIKELGDVIAMFVERGGKRISARSISDGTLHFLGTLLALRTAEPGSVILIEDIEAGLHPTRIRLLVEYLEAVTRERQIQVIATTHSPVVLQWLSDEALRNAIVFGRVPDHEGTIVRRLGDLQYFNEVVERAGIEEMFTTGWLEMAL
jgi:putative AbiEii toxin of type IV toxin-antitoxin system/AAA ATPase-like protein